MLYALFLANLNRAGNSNMIESVHFLSPMAPTHCSWYKSGQPLKEIHYDAYGRRHKLDGPAYRSWYEDGRSCKEKYYVAGKLHKLDGPARRWWRPTGQLLEERWYAVGQLHRVDGPAHHIWYKSGQLRMEWHYMAGLPYNLYGPTFRSWYKTGEPCTEKHDMLNRRAYRNWHMSGQIIVQNYSINGVWRTLDEFRTSTKDETIHAALRPIYRPIRDVIWHHYCCI